VTRARRLKKLLVFEIMRLRKFCRTKRPSTAHEKSMQATYHEEVSPIPSLRNAMIAPFRLEI
jgi:hypothetical protein